MPAPAPLFQAVLHRIVAHTKAQGVPIASARRLVLLVTGLLAARSVVLAQVAAELLALGVTRATEAEHIERRLRRALGDRHLEPETCYTSALPKVLDWRALQGTRAVPGARGVVVLAADDSSKADQIHLFRVSLCSRGGSLPLAWKAWAQNVPQPEGSYWAAVEAVLAQVATLLPADVAVVLTGDRAFDVPAFVDRAVARGWHWVVRAKANSDLRFRGHRGHEHALRDLVRRYVPVPGQRWKARGWVFKGAGWRAASVVALWTTGEAEPLVVLTDLPPRWDVLRLYGARFWIEPGFRTDKTRGWHWEDSQVRGVAHHQRLLLAMAWASLLTLCLGLEEAQRRLVVQATRAARALQTGRCPAKPQPARESLFTLGLRRTRHWLYPGPDPPKHPLPWRFPPGDLLTWDRLWYHHQAYAFLFGPTVRS